MSKFVIVVVNRTQARFFTLDTAELDLSVVETVAKLRERQGLLNSVAELQGQELWANTKTGRNRGTRGQAHSYDDHRQDHMLEFDRQFAQKITNRIAHLLESEQARQLILVAEPQFLGLMRETLKSPLFKAIKIEELDKDICHFSSLQIHDYLAKRKLLPARSRML
ncbi:host attachment protein [Myxosarcina sp. GI1(2024)]